MSDEFPRPVPSKEPEVGDRKKIEGVLHTWDGTGWVPVPTPEGASDVQDQ
jgi:hypothetical protein